jgi:hypothetical protein
LADSGAAKYKKPTVMNEVRLYRYYAETYSAKYQAAMTPAVVTRNIPRATAHVQNHMVMVRVIAQFAHPLRCHSRPEAGCETYPTRSKRKVSVKKGIDNRRATSRTEGERRSKRG